MADEWDGRERREKSQWSIDSWSALQSAATLLMMAVAGLVWGLKLEGRIDMIGSGHKADMDKMEGKVMALETVTQKGILPVTEVRLHAVESQVDGMKRELAECVGKKR
jgi:hypothetical protein